MTDRAEIIAGTPPGGGQDRAARALAAALDCETDVTNVPGRGGGNAWDALARRAGDGTVISISSPTLITNRLLGIADIDESDVTPLAHLCTEFLAFVATGSTTSLRLLERAAVGDLTTAIATERGNVNHIALGRVVAASGADPSTAEVRVFDSARYAVADLIAGNAQLAVVSAASVIPELEAGTVSVLATSAPTRMTAPFDSVPTWSELGVDCVIGTWRGAVGPPGLAPDDADRWAARIEAAVRTDSWAEAVRRHRWTDTYLDREALSTFLIDERRTLTTGLRDLGVLDG